MNLPPSPSSAPESSVASPSRWELPGFTLFFLAALAAHFFFTTANWRSGILTVNEYRETHTAISAMFIQREHNFSPAYPTPILGKPWSVPYEFPLYQWAVVALSDTTGLPLIAAGRMVSLAGFYLGLPALWILLARLGLAPPRRLLVLGLVLTCPLYVFFVRAFLIETTALLLSLWFLAGFITALERRSVGWLLVTNLAGLGAGLGKVTTFIVWLLPAGALAAAWLWRDRPRRVAGRFDCRPFMRTFGWLVASVALPFAATVAWVRFSDATKALNVSAVQLLSGALSDYNLGTLKIRLAPDVWLVHARDILHSVLAPVALVLFALAALFAGRWRKWILGGLVLFAAGPAIFPVLYACHEYYFLAVGLFLLTAIGLAFAGLLDRPHARFAVLPLLGLFVAAQAWGYFHQFYAMQTAAGPAGSGLAHLLHDATEPADVLVIAGQDWSPAVPFYAERRALMIRQTRDREAAYVDRAFAALHGESVPALVLTGDVRENHVFLRQAVAAFDLDPEPFVFYGDSTVYVSRRQRPEICRRLFNLGSDAVFARPAEHLTSAEPQPVAALRSQALFAGMSPRPVRYQVPYALGAFGLHDGLPRFALNATSRLWFAPPQNTTQVTMDFGVIDEAFAHPPNCSDGVEFALLAECRDGTRQPLFVRFLSPLVRPADHGPQHLVLRLDPSAEITGYVLETRPGPADNGAFDWAYLARIEFR